MYRSALETPVHYQWDADSRYPLPDPGSAPNNCGPASVANIAHFYRDAHFGIYSTRRLAVTDWWRATSVTEQKIMLEKRGVPCLVGRWPLNSIKSTISSGRHPMLLGLDMSNVPLAYAGHPFRGWHAVVALQNAVYSGQSGILIRDPNFNRSYRQDPTGGKRFYPDWVIQRAFVDSNGWGLMPLSAKIVTAQRLAVIAATSYIYDAPILAIEHVIAREAVQIELQYAGVVHGDNYQWSGGSSDLWARLGPIGGIYRYIPYYRVLRFKNA